MADQTSRILRIASDLFGRGEITNAEAFALVHVELVDADEIKEKGGTFSLDGLLSLNGLLPRSLSRFAASDDDQDAQKAEQQAEQLEHARDQKEDR